jgi:hypothetical protein
MTRAMKTLLAGQPLSEAQAREFVANVRRRTRPDFAWTGGEIKLTGDQRKAGRRKYPHLLHKVVGPAEFASVSRAEFVALQAQVEELRATTQRLSLGSHSPPIELPREKHPEGSKIAKEAAENGEFPMEKATVTRRNETKHHESMISPPGGINHDRGRALCSSSTSKKVEGNGVGTNPPRQANALTIWAKEVEGKRSVTGNLDYDGEKHRLVFTSFDSALERLRALEGWEAWCSDINRQIGSSASRHDSEAEGYARCWVSPIYGVNDSWGYKAPSVPEALIFLTWEEGLPTSATIMLGDGTREVKLSPEKHGRYHKGYIA